MYINSRTYDKVGTKVDRPAQIARSSRREVVERCAIVGLILVAIATVSVAMISNEFSRKVEQGKKSQLNSAELPKSADFNRGIQFLFDNDHGAAFSSFSRALELDKNSVDAMVGRGVALARMGKFAKAEVDFSAAARIKQNASAIYMNLANTREKSSDIFGSIENYSRAISLDPNLSSAYGNRARCYFMRGQFSQALDDLSHVIRLDKRNPLAYLNRAITLARLARFDTAITNLSHPSLEGAASQETRKLAALLQLQSGNAIDSLRTSRLGLEQIPSDAEFKLLSFAAMKVLADADPQLSSDASVSWATARDELGSDYELLSNSYADLESLTTAFQVAGCCQPRFMLLSEGVTMALPISRNVATEQAIEALEYLRVGDLETAVACLREALRNAPEDKEITMKLVMALLDQGRIEIAIEELAKVEGRFLNDKKVCGLLSMLYSRLGNFRDAIASLDRAISIDSSDSELYLLRANVRYLEGLDHKQVLADCTRAERFGLSSAALFGVKAAALKELGESDLAIAAYSSAIGLDPKNVLGLLNRSMAYREFGQTKSALADARTAADIDGKSAAAFYELSLCYSDLEQDESALSSIDTALNLAPLDSKLRVQKGRVLMKMQRHDEAIASFSRAEKKLLSKEDHYSMAVYYFQAKDNEKAWLSSSSALEMGPPSADLLVISGRIAYFREDLPKANSLLEKAVESGAGTADVYSLLGKCASTRRDFESALKYFKKSLKMGGANSAETWFATGRVFEQDGKTSQAVRCYAKALEIDAENPIARLARARTLVSLQDYRSALEDLKWLLSNNANDEAAAQMIKVCKTKLAKTR